MSEIYRTSMTAKGGRDGAVYAPGGALVFELSIPQEMGGTGEDGTNPEQLFAAGYAACFLGSIDLAARRQQTSLPENPAVSATVHLGKHGNGFAISVDLVVDIPGMEAGAARNLLDAAHAICPYSRVMRDGASVTTSLSAGAPHRRAGASKTLQS